MEKDISRIIKVYHYTTDEGWQGMNHGIDGYKFEDPHTGNYVDGLEIRGLFPIQRFLAEGYGTGLPRNFRPRMVT